MDKAKEKWLDIIARCEHTLTDVKYPRDESNLVGDLLGARILKQVGDKENAGKVIKISSSYKMGEIARAFYVLVDSLLEDNQEPWHFKALSIQIEFVWKHLKKVFEVDSLEATEKIRRMNDGQFKTFLRDNGLDDKGAQKMKYVVAMIVTQRKFKSESKKQADEIEKLNKELMHK